MSDPLPGLRSELVAAAGRRIRAGRRRSRLRRLAPVAIAAAVVAVVAMVTVTSTDPASAGLDITVRNGSIEVLLTDVETRPEVVEDALREVGINASVDSVPVGPSLLGRFIGSGTALVPELQPVDEAGQAFPGFIIPEGYSDELRLQLGRPAAPGEAYAVSSDAYAPGEPLSCLEIHGRRVRELPDALGAADLVVRVQIYIDDAPSGPQLSPDAAAAGPFSSFILNDALATSATDVIINATEDGQSPFLKPLSADEGACRE